MTDLERDLRKAIKIYRAEPERFLSKHVRIVDKDRGTLIYFFLNHPQAILNELIKERQRDRKPASIIILKARQIGFTTYVAGLNLLNSMYRENVWSLIVNSTTNDTQDLLSKYKGMYNGMTGIPKPGTKKDSRNELEFLGTGSGITVRTANKKGLGRGQVYTRFHGTETAFWDKPYVAMKACRQCFSDVNPVTFMFEESTANGKGGYFFDRWQAATSGNTDLLPFFFPWWHHPRYQMDVPPGFVPSDYERRIQEKYNLSDRQIAWYQWAIVNKCDGDPDFMKQEYPTFAEEAFMFTGRGVFAKVCLEEMQLRVDGVDPIWVGQFGPQGDRMWGCDDELMIWKEPEPGRHYVIGADPAEGYEGEREEGGRTEDGDYSVADVLDCVSLEQVAQLRGHIDPATA